MGNSIKASEISDNAYFNIVNNLFPEDMFAAEGELNSGIMSYFGKGKSRQEMLDSLNKKFRSVAENSNASDKKYTIAKFSDFIGALKGDQYDVNNRNEILEHLADIDSFQQLVNEVNEANDYADMSDSGMQALCGFLRNVKSADCEQKNLIAEHEARFLNTAAEASDTESKEITDEHGKVIYTAAEVGFPLGEMSKKDKQLLKETSDAMKAGMKKIIDSSDAIKAALDKTDKKLTQKQAGLDILKLQRVILTKNFNIGNIKDNNERARQHLELNNNEQCELGRLTDILDPEEADKVQIVTNHILSSDFTEESCKELCDKFDAKIAKYEKESAPETAAMQKQKEDLTNASQTAEKECKQMKDIYDKTLHGLENKNKDIHKRVEKLDDALKENTRRSVINLDENDRRISQIKKRAENMQRALSKGMRKGHGNSKEFNAMTKALDDFIKEPTSENLKAVSENAQHYKELKQNGFHVEAFASSMRKHRLNCAEELISLSADGQRTMENTAKTNQTFDSVRNTFRDLNPIPGYTRRMENIPEADVSKFNKMAVAAFEKDVAKVLGKINGGLELAQKLLGKEPGEPQKESAEKKEEAPQMKKPSGAPKRIR